MADKMEQDGGSLSIKERIQRLRLLRDESGKFSKSDAYYVSDAANKPIRCANCIYFDGEGKTCDLVSEEGQPSPGIISPEGSCTLFDASPLRITALQWLWGRGDIEGAAPGRVRATVILYGYAALEDNPPEELLEKSLVDFETIQKFFPGFASKIASPPSKR